MEISKVDENGTVTLKLKGCLDTAATADFAVTGLDEVFEIR